ncbi:hypothetical protein ACFL35_11490 [Candidatus Riflebacteria bacterium]
MSPENSKKSILAQIFTALLFGAFLLAVVKVYPVLLKALLKAGGMQVEQDIHSGDKKGISQQDALVIDQWMEFYYREKKIGLVGEMISKFIQGGYTNKPQVFAPGVGFFSSIFKQNPNKVLSWLKDGEKWALADKKLFFHALWQADIAPGKTFFQKLLKSKSKENLELAKEFTTKKPELLEKMEIKTPADMDMCWGAFFATGNPQFINKLIKLLDRYNSKNSRDRSMVGAAEWSLRANAMDHPEVTNICRQQVLKLTGVPKKILERVLSKKQSGNTVARNDKELLARQREFRGDSLWDKYSYFSYNVAGGSILARFLAKGNEVKIEGTLPGKEGVTEVSFFIFPGYLYLSKNKKLNTFEEGRIIEGLGLRSRMILSLLSHAFPDGPDGIGQKKTVDVEDRKKILSYRFLSGVGRLNPPWKLKGTVEKKEDNIINFELELQYTGTKGDKNTKITGTWKGGDSENILPDTEKLTGWIVRFKGSFAKEKDGKSTFTPLLKEAKNLRTFGDIRSAINKQK